MLERHTIESNLFYSVECERDAKLHECKETKVEVPANFTADEDNSLRNELENLDSAVEEIKDVIENNVQSLNLVQICNAIISKSHYFSDKCRWVDVCLGEAAEGRGCGD